MFGLEPATSKRTLPPQFMPPATYAVAMRHARQISRGFDYLRIDFLSTDSELYAGEITIYPNAGLTLAKGDPSTDINELTNVSWDLRKSDFFKSSVDQK